MRASPIVQLDDRTPTGPSFERKLLYRWHPWTGRRIFVHEVIDKNEAAVFRCSLSGQESDRWLEVPAWMFARDPSTSWRITDAPHVDLAALGTLATLLRDSGASSQSQEMGAAWAKAWNPEQIARRLPINFKTMRISHEAI